MRTAKKTVTEILLATALVIAAGCGASVQSSVAPNTNLSQYKTFGFFTSPGQTQSVADQDIDSALRQALMARGFTEATSGSAPDFLVAHHVKMQQQMDVNGFGYGYGWGWGGGGVDAYTYTQGTLIVDFIDPKINKAFWRGTASEVVNNPSSPNSQKIQAAVEKLIGKYPVNMAVAPNTTM